MEGRELKVIIFLPFPSIRNWKRDVDVPRHKKGLTRSSTVFHQAAKFPKADAYVNALVLIPTRIVCLKWWGKGMRGKSIYCWSVPSWGPRQRNDCSLCFPRTSSSLFPFTLTLRLRTHLVFLFSWKLHCSCCVVLDWWGQTVTIEEPNKPQLKPTVTYSIEGSPFPFPSSKEDSTGNKEAIHPRVLASPVTDATRPNQCVTQTSKGRTSSKDLCFSPAIKHIKHIFNCQRTGQHFVSYIRVFSQHSENLICIWNCNITNSVNNLELCDSSPTHHLYKFAGLCCCPSSAQKDSCSLLYWLVLTHSTCVMALCFFLGNTCVETLVRLAAPRISSCLPDVASSFKQNCVLFILLPFTGKNPGMFLPRHL